MSSDRTMRLQVVLQAIDKVSAIFGGIGKKSKDASAALKEVLDELKELKIRQDALGKSKAAEAALKGTSDKLDAMRIKLAELKDQQAAAAKGTFEHTKELKETAKAVKTLTRDYKEQGDTVQGLKAKLNNLGVHNAAWEERRLAVAIEGATAKANKQRIELERLKSAFNQAAKAKRLYDQRMARANQFAVGGAGSLAVGYGMASPLRLATGAFMDQEDAAIALRNTMTNSAGEVQADFERLNELAKRLGDRLPGTTTDFQNMMTTLRRQDIAASDVLNGVGESAAYLAVQLKMPADQAAEMAAKIQKATGTSSSDMMALMDQMQRTFNMGMDPNDMLQGITKMGPAMAVLRKQGLPAMRDLMPMLVMMNQAGMAGETAGNAIRKVMQFSVDAQKRGKANKTLAGTGIRIDLSDGKGEFGGFQKLFAQLDKLNKLNSERRGAALKALFGDDAETMQVLGTLLKDGSAGFSATLAKMDAQADLRKRVEDQLGTLRNKMEATGGNFTNSMAEVGKVMAPELKSITDQLGEAANAAGRWANEHPKLTKILVFSVVTVALLAIAVGGLMLSAYAVLAPLAGLKMALSVLAPVLSVLSGSVAFLAAAIGLPVWVFLAFVAIFVAGIALIITYWDELCAFFKFGFTQAWGFIKALFTGDLDWFITQFKATWDKILGIYNWVREKLGFGTSAEATLKTVNIDQRGPIASAEANGAGAGRGYVNNNNVTVMATPGTDGAAIGRQVLLELEKLQRAQAAQGRSALADSR